ncbi:hypothetical protein FQA47_006665 [Oryzias melastigma]|uniref:Uncharacterized protein n=1 Tax=Oryzias melastigma TaxID=30732 RepID=A0A834BUR8_ORYME|nr:hypothetical protein FQA47_006665 [Oryzias melastigma]
MHEDFFVGLSVCTNDLSLTALKCVDAFDLEKHLDTTAAAYTQCSLRAPECDMSNVIFSPSWECYQRITTHSRSSGLFSSGNIRNALKLREHKEKLLPNNQMRKGN